ncbi:hypothetical protein FA13DRAFT_1730775 [Coprinellus micaceus]|uniref:Uncharacterized protein n=1 Tax=Coprinellus micaceus TaxID=71717 RepID=A0A4Y7TFU2_COPMI|nr:hypothetical protein FA13DRAFT_1730775 [Coprinellus micaceus]
MSLFGIDYTRSVSKFIGERSRPSVTRRTSHCTPSASGIFEKPPCHSESLEDVPDDAPTRQKGPQAVAN